MKIYALDEWSQNIYQTFYYFLINQYREECDVFIVDYICLDFKAPGERGFGALRTTNGKQVIYIAGSNPELALADGLYLFAHEYKHLLQYRLGRPVDEEEAIKWAQKEVKKFLYGEQYERNNFQD